MVIETCTESTQPLLSVPITIMAGGGGDIGFVNTILPVVFTSTEDGLHEYVLAPDATIVALCPWQVDTGGTVTTGKGFIVTVTCAVAVHPLLLPITVYVAVDAG